MLDYYILRSPTSFCNLSIDKADIEKIIPVEDIKQFDELRFSWDPLLTIQKDGIPRYIGLIAIQCFAASQMQRDEYNAADAYKVRLAEVLGLDNIQDLQNLFNRNNQKPSIQEQIWLQAKVFFSDKLGQDLDLPEPISGWGKFVQFPKSQALLNVEDLKHFTIFFAEEWNVKEDIPFSYFKQRLQRSLHNITQTAKTKLLLEHGQKRDQCIQQVYDYFNVWNGEIYDYSLLRKPTSATEKMQQYSPSYRLLMTIDDNQPAFYVLDENYEVVKEMDAAEVLACKIVNNGKTGLLFFNEAEYYKNEFLASRFLYTDISNYILLNTASWPNESSFLEASGTAVIAMGKNIILYKLDLQEKCENSPFRQYCQAKNPIQLLGGIRGNRKRAYIAGFGPSIVCSQPFFVIYDNKRCDYDPLLAKEGLYKIRIDNFRDIEMHIVKPATLEKLIEPKQLGWNLKRMQLGEEYQVEGCWIQQQEENSMRWWMELNLSGKKKRPYGGSNLLIKAINQARL